MTSTVHAFEGHRAASSGERRIAIGDPRPALERTRLPLATSSTQDPASRAQIGRPRDWARASYGRSAHGQRSALAKIFAQERKCITGVLAALLVGTSAIAGGAREPASGQNEVQPPPSFGQGVERPVRWRSGAEPFRGQIQQVLRHPVYAGLAEDERRKINEIIDWMSFDHGTQSYYANRLIALLSTPDASRDETASMQRARLERSLRAAEQLRTEQRDGFVPPAKRASLEEELSNASTRRWTELKGLDDVVYKVDREDPTMVVAEIKVHLLGDPKDVLGVRALEDLAEKFSAAPGYTLNIVFVDHDGPDVVSVPVDMSQFASTANFACDAECLAHEIHHWLGLPDRYDYSNYADVSMMPMRERIHWFHEETKRVQDPDMLRSLMGTRGAPPTDRDVCGVAQLDDHCLEARAKARDQHGRPSRRNVINSAE
ncbi:MAG: hypothetical protein IPK13_10570 [Deltaproteobacteria bacterium]|nr:hypothetical protein [Deltaproteobacteria bacterium]